MTHSEVVKTLRNKTQENKKNMDRKTRIKKAVKHSVRVFGTAGVWYISTWVHDSPVMIVIAIVGVFVQTIVEEFIVEE